MLLQNMIWVKHQIPTRRLILWHSDSYEQGTWLKGCLDNFLPFTTCLFLKSLPIMIK